jgi:alpha-L-glutamate ligase-like protein
VNWYTIWNRLKSVGVLGMNHRNAACILDLNPRRGYPAVDSKSRTYALCAAIGVPYPYLYGQIAAHSAMRHLPRLLQGRDDFVIKPDRGAGGRGILVIKGRDGEGFLRHNGERLDVNDLRQHVSGVVSGLYSLGGNADVALLQQRVQLHPAMAAISYQGIGDVRVILYKRQPAMAMLRLPTRESGGRANLHQGGIGAGIDMITGLTCRAVCRNRVAYRHPDTGTSLVDFQVPYWPDILNMAVKVAGAVELGYLGVDIVIDRDRGPLLLEANARPGLAIQIANGRGLMPRLQEIEESLAEIARSQKALGTKDDLV